MNRRGRIDDPKQTELWSARIIIFKRPIDKAYFRTLTKRLRRRRQRLSLFLRSETQEREP